MGEAADDPGVGIQVVVVPAAASANARVARGDIEDWIFGSAGNGDPGDLAVVHTLVEAAVVVVVGDALDQVDLVDVGSLPGITVVGDVGDLDQAVLLGDVETAVGSELE